LTLPVNIGKMSMLVNLDVVSTTEKRGMGVELVGWIKKRRML